MEDETIVDLYWQRSSKAIEETDKKYGDYCRSIACRILHSREDAEECLDDTYILYETEGAYIVCTTKNLEPRALESLIDCADLSKLA